jgi:hypothetical protein
VVHGDLHEDNLLVESGRVTAVTGWTDLRIGDPADDFAWLVASNEQDFINAVLKAYTSSRRDAPDQHLLRRAALSAEFALAQYLVKGLAAGDQDMVTEAEGMLESLASDIAEYGGQPISVEPLPAAGAAATSEPAAVAGPAAVPGAGAVPGTGATAGSAPTTRTAATPPAKAMGNPAAGSGSSAVTPAVTVIPVPAQPAAVAPAAVQARPASEGQTPSTPAVQVTPIPVEPPSANAQPADVPHARSAGVSDEKAGDPDDTSTAAISIINVKQG